MHLEIILSKDRVEDLGNSQVVLKLYDLTYENEDLAIVRLIDSTSVIKGNIRVNAAYLNLLEYLTQILKEEDPSKFDILITAGSVYIYFKDRNVELALINAGIGDGTGITLADAATARIGTIFRNNTDITSFEEFDKFTISNSNGNFSFYGCTNLESINLSNLSTFPNQESNKGAFQNTGLIEVNDLGTISRLRDRAFQGCSNLTRVILPLTCKIVDARTFLGCPNLTFTQEDLQYVEDLGWSTSDRDYGVFGLGNSKSLYISENLNLLNLKSLGDAAFRDLTSIRHVNLPNLLNLSGLRTFSQCTNLIDVSIGIRDNGDGTYTHSVLNLTDGLSYSIGQSFANCSSLKEIHFTNNLTVMSLYMFMGCNNLDVIDIDFSKITTIYGGAFAGCSSIGSQDGSKVMNFSNAISLGNGRGNFANTSMLHIYLPKITAMPKASGYQRYSYIDSLFISLGWDYHARINTLYLRDITSIGRGSFYLFVLLSYNIIETLIINNTTVPTMEDVTDTNLINDTANSNPVNSSSPFLNCTIGNIYVPDGYEQAYRDSGLFDSTNLAKIKGISQCPRITVAQANAGLTGVIADYM